MTVLVSPLFEKKKKENNLLLIHTKRFSIRNKRLYDSIHKFYAFETKLNNCIAVTGIAIKTR